MVSDLQARVVPEEAIPQKNAPSLSLAPPNAKPLRRPPKSASKEGGGRLQKDVTAAQRRLVCSADAYLSGPEASSANRATVVADASARRCGRSAALFHLFSVYSRSVRLRVREGGTRRGREGELPRERFVRFLRPEVRIAWRRRRSHGGLRIRAGYLRGVIGILPRGSSVKEKRGMNPLCIPLPVRVCVRGRAFSAAVVACPRHASQKVTRGCIS